MTQIPSDRLGRSQIKLIKIEALLVRHAWRPVFQFLEVAVPYEEFRQVLEHVERRDPGADMSDRISAALGRPP